MSVTASTVTALPSLILSRATSTSLSTTWTIEVALKAPAKFCLDLLAAMRGWKAGRMTPEATTRDRKKAGGIYARNPNATNERAFQISCAKVLAANENFENAVMILAKLPNLNGITIGKIEGVERTLTARDLLDGLTLPPSQSEIAAWLAEA